MPWCQKQSSGGSSFLYWYVYWALSRVGIGIFRADHYYCRYLSTVVEPFHNPDGLSLARIYPQFVPVQIHARAVQGECKWNASAKRVKEIQGRRRSKV
jgi:hypothetical protein